MMKANNKVLNYYNKSNQFIIDIISKFYNYDCSFINEDKNFLILIEDLNKILGINWVIKIKQKFFNKYIIDKYILKISFYLYPEYIIYTSEMVKTYYRKNFKFKSKNNILLIGIEIQDYIDNDYICNEKELYKVYKTLREKGYIWMDAQLRNIKKDKDKIVIVDLDYIYKYENADFSNQSLLSKKLEKQYIQEKTILK